MLQLAGSQELGSKCHFFKVNWSLSVEIGPEQAEKSLCFGFHCQYVSIYPQPNFLNTLNLKKITWKSGKSELFTEKIRCFCLLPGWKLVKSRCWWDRTFGDWYFKWLCSHQTMNTGKYWSQPPKASVLLFIILHETGGNVLSALWNSILSA